MDKTEFNFTYRNMNLEMRKITHSSISQLLQIFDIYKNQELIALLIFGNKRERFQLLQNTNLDEIINLSAELENSMCSCSTEKNLDIYNLISLLNTYIYTINYDSFSIFNSFFSASNDNDIKSQFHPILERWKIPILLFQNESSECFGFALKAHRYFKKLGIKSQLYASLIGINDMNKKNYDYNHICIMVQNSRDEKCYLIDPFYDIKQPILLKKNSMFKRRDGRIFKVIEYNTRHIILEKENRKMMRYFPIERAQIELDLKQILRFKDREPQFINKHTPERKYIRFVPKTGKIYSNVEELNNLDFTKEIIISKEKALCFHLGSSKVFPELLRYRNYLDILPENFWL